MVRKRVGPPKISKVKTTKSGSTRTYTKSLSGKWSIQVGVERHLEERSDRE